MMNTPAQCKTCGAELPADAPQGLCPACLLKGALNTESAMSGGGQTGHRDFTPPTPELLAPSFPDLEILEFIGRGGMGMVYKARQKSLNRLVALKILLPRMSNDPAFAERFAREARAMALLNHPHVVAVHDFGKTTDRETPLYYFLMEFVDGLTLRQLLNSGALTPEGALAIVPQICDALQYAHDKGVVHRDIKPENILLDKSGQVKIADFGLAKLLGQESDDFSLTGVGQAMGTPSYMAPEQIERPREVDHRADIYSLGVVFYQMLTGELPLGRFAPPSRKVQIDVRLDEVVLRALEKEPELRYQQASSLKTEVETISQRPPSASPVPPKRASTGSDGTSSKDSRFSRTAIVGAVWASLFFVFLFQWFVVAIPVTTHRPVAPPAWWQLLLYTIWLLGLTAPFGTTISGVVALGQIRHSAGRLYGLSLALFDAMLFPLLALYGLIACGIFGIWATMGHLLVPFGRSGEPNMFAVVLLALLVWCVVGFWIVRWSWHAAKKPLDDA